MQRISVGDIDTFKPIRNELFHAESENVSYAVYFGRVDLENCDVRIPAEDQSREDETGIS